MTKSRKARISLMLLSFVLATIQLYLVVGIFDYMHSGKLIPNLLDDVVGRPLVDWLVWLLYGAFAVLVPLYFRIRGKAALNTTATSVIAFGANIATMISWYFCQSSLVLFSTGIVIMIMTALFNTILVAVMYVLLIHVLFPEN